MSATFQTSVDAVIDRLKVRLEDGKVSISELYSLLIESIGDIAILGGAAKDLTDDDIKSVAVHASKRIYEEIVAPIDLPFVPNWLEPTVDVAGATLMQPAVSGIVDGILKLFRKHKVVE